MADMADRARPTPGFTHGRLIDAEKTNPRLRRRRRAVWRLKAYGIAAIVVSALALLALLSSVVVQTGKALTESYITLPVTLDAAKIDPDGTGDPKVILRGDFGAITKQALRELFPQVKSRKAKKQLYGLVSSGAAFELAAKVAADPSLLGQRITFDFLASDVTDLYLKGEFGRLSPMPARGALSVAKKGRVYEITSTARDFAAAMEQIRARLRNDARLLRVKAALQNNGAAVFRQRAEEAETDQARAQALAEADARAARRDALLAEAAKLEARAANDGAEKLTRRDRSLMIHVAGGWLKLTKIAPDRAEAVALTPLTAPVEGETAWSFYLSDLPESARKFSDLAVALTEDLAARGAVKSVFNWRFFTASDSREPELAGIRGAAVGSFWTMLVTFLLAFPVGVLAAIYLEEFAPRNRITAFIEVNINNLAAVPSIIFGLLGLAVVIGFMGVPRSSPLAGGIVMALMTLPTIIIASRAAIAAVPPSIREAALGVGASHQQAVFHHVLPLAVPGMLTGAILGMARALGETAPLIMIGMVAFIVDVPRSITDSATVLPVQIYRWSDFPERAFEARTGAAIAVLLLFLVAMNAIAILLRRRFERRW